MQIMSSLPFTDQQCFFVAIFVFIILGFQRGWRRELISLVFILLGVFLVNSGNFKTVSSFLTRIPNMIGFLITGSQTSANPVIQPVANVLGPWGPLLLFAAIVVVGYLVGNKAFPKPATPSDRFLGIIPAIISGAFVLVYLGSFFPKDATGHTVFSVAVQSPDPANYISVIIVIAIVAVVVALIAARAKKPAKK
jgi:drug/metabolite transporter (DMT)-like permease